MIIHMCIPSFVEYPVFNLKDSKSIIVFYVNCPVTFLLTKVMVGPSVVHEVSHVKSGANAAREWTMSN